MWSLFNIFMLEIFSFREYQKMMFSLQRDKFPF